ncbi:MAG TPA: tRNA (adenosine(37)-N6)-threonylcarbamoyltransferase complex ATPase subunit type 1 TsaE [Blastocatellia bacterium]|nr:tRNA (adenosine(37)-N6)-threonylcarbamoyltransferase complex ATPase subunit type 1 TsaE [Blastocatellia bacterium]
MTESSVPDGTFITHSAEETFDLAYRIGETITAATVFLLSGDLGAGKTVFTKGLAAGLEIDPAEVSSPTFTLVNAHDGRMRLYHLDLYRLSGSADEVYALGLDEMLTEPNAVVVIEWAERMGSFAIPNAWRVHISDSGADDRRIEIHQQQN